jgi:murein L,D-transpeptidase YafK
VIRLGLAIAIAPIPASASVPEPADRILLDKSEHRLTVFKDGKRVRSFRVALGRGGLAPKQRQGDNRVPEGRYRITGRNPASAFYRSLKIGYPTPAQRAAARARGVNPGGDIFIHGLPNGRGWLGSNHRRVDWTHGCIAVTNAELDWLWRNIRDGTPIEIVA